MTDRTANLLGVLGLAVADRIEDIARDILGRVGETPAALVVIGHGTGLSNDGLRRILRLSHPGTVRLVDRLVADGLVERGEGKDRRAVALRLTEQGRRIRDKLLQGRLSALDALLVPLSEQERELFDGLLDKILISMDTTVSDRRTLCRLCDVQVCSDCPIPASEGRAA
ncbi:MarR family transcriptional regulator [Ruegeria sp. R13_0]|uniref:MarR family winged helix-turn-helix transcriptional regulator n=1 Tax=Ruegeria sp. R13_0 TaxID=2821099 RepID=UPI001AD9AAF8|nr:MarR family transcriptional regulator [Ruegeria sp. R13_0]MBO9436912.1 MarR family transcriptional regulator [Ruegeria sp. R13_0]